MRFSAMKNDYVRGNDHQIVIARGGSERNPSDDCDKAVAAVTYLIPQSSDASSKQAVIQLCPQYLAEQGVATMRPMQSWQHQVKSSFSKMVKAFTDSFSTKNTGPDMDMVATLHIRILHEVRGSSL
jgi:hypothetical protein